MNVSADQVRAATRVAAAVITQETVPPLRLDESPGGRRPRSRPGSARSAASSVGSATGPTQSLKL